MKLKKAKFQRKMNQSGFSLVEVTISSIIFAMTSVGILTLLSSSRPANEVAFQRTQAAYYAQSVLEDLRTRVDQRPGAGALLANGTRAYPSVTVSGVTYTATYTVSDDLTIGPINPKKVDVTVTW